MLNLPSPLQMRPSTEADQAFLLGLYHSTRDDLLSEQADPAMLTGLMAMQYQMQDRAYREMHPDAGHWLVLSDGYAIGRMILAQYPQHFHLLDISLLPERRQSGHGTALLKALMKYAAMAGKSVSLYVGRHNSLAFQLYLRLGFVPDASDPLQIRMCWKAPGQEELQ
jgi:ribosomal protein S18 acetylase RimI-like enzyme